MTAWVALLRAVNVGGTGKIEMARLRDTVKRAGFADARTYIASGNLVFSGGKDAGTVSKALGAAIAADFGVCPEILLRSGAEMADVVQRNPFQEAPGNQVLVLFCAAQASNEGLRHQKDEKVYVSGRELFVHFPSGMGQSKLVIPAASLGTGRNMNTVNKLAAMAAEFA